MQPRPRPGPKPKRLYVRTAKTLGAPSPDWPDARRLRNFLGNLERVGRLVAHGPLTEPPGDLLILRAADSSEAQRILRADPFRGLESTSYEVAAWKPTDAGSGVNLEPPPAIGSGRLTLLHRVAVFVRDQAKALAWYQEVLGLTLRTHDTETAYVELALGRGTAALSLVSPRPEWGEPAYSEAASRIGSMTGIVFQTDSIPALELRLKHAGAKVTQPPERQPWGGSVLRFADPDGNEFLAFEPERGKSSTPTD